MSEPKPIRFGAIGCGGMGTVRLQELAKHPLGVKIVAAVDINPDRLDNLAKVLGYNDFKRYTGPEDYKKLIDENDLDAVGVFTPHVPHYYHVKYALQKGLNVLCEKPMVCGAKNAIEITQLCNAQKKIGIVHYQRHGAGLERPDVARHPRTLRRRPDQRLRLPLSGYHSVDARRTAGLR